MVNWNSPTEVCHKSSTFLSLVEDSSSSSFNCSLFSFVASVPAGLEKLTFFHCEFHCITFKRQMHFFQVYDFVFLHFDSFGPTQINVILLRNMNLSIKPNKLNKPLSFLDSTPPGEDESVFSIGIIVVRSNCSDTVSTVAVIICSKNCKINQKNYSILNSL